MKYYKRVENEYIILIGENCGGIEITETEYNAIFSVIRSKPVATEGYDYRLREDLTWELYELPVVPPEEEDAAEEDYKSALAEFGVSE